MRSRYRRAGWRLQSGRAGRTAVERARGIAPARSSPACCSPPPPSVQPSPPAHPGRRRSPRRPPRHGGPPRAAAAPSRPDGPRPHADAVFAGGSTWTRTRRLAEPSHRDDDPRTVAYQLVDAAGLQRGRLTGLGALRCLAAPSRSTSRDSPRATAARPGRPYRSELVHLLWCGHRGTRGTPAYASFDGRELHALPERQGGHLLHPPGRRAGLGFHRGARLTRRLPGHRAPAHGDVTSPAHGPG